MPSLAQTKAISDLAGFLYNFLPGSSQWRGTYTFAHAAQERGVEKFWVGGSKRPAIETLLEQTFDRRSDQFCPLIVTIVQHGIKYRAKKGNPLAKEDLDQLNELLHKVGFRIPELCDPKFRDSLPDAEGDSETLVSDSTSGTVIDDKKHEFDRALKHLHSEFLSLMDMTNRQKAGLLLEQVLNKVFGLHGLSPQQPFTVIGEQIDGAFVLNGDHYLVEAKWSAKPTPASQLYSFRGKVEGKSAFTRGLFVSINGFSGPALEQITRGKQPTFVMMDGTDLFYVLNGSIRLDDLLERKVRLLATLGKPFVSFSEIMG